MKSAFEIKEEESVGENTQTLLEVAEYGISVLKFKKDPLSIVAVSVYNFQADEDGDNFLAKCQEIIDSHRVEDKDSVHVFYNFREALLIPSEYMHEENASSQLALIYGSAPDCEVVYQEVTIDSGIGKQDKMYCVFRVPHFINTLIKELTSNRPMHSTGKQIKLKGADEIHCTIFHNTIKVFLYGNNQILLIQQFGYKTPADVVYHLLNICDKHKIDAAGATLLIDGMVDSGSSLYQEVYKYFTNVHFNVIANDVYLSPGVKEHPLHFITHLTELARCV